VSAKSKFLTETDFFGLFKQDDLVKSLKRPISVIPAKAGIQLFQILKNSLDSGLRRAQPSRFHRSDVFLRQHKAGFCADTHTDTFFGHFV